MPTPQALEAVLTAAAQDVWSDIGRDDPAAEWVRPYLTSGASLLDFGAGHGDLLRLLAPDAVRRSALDAIRYPPAAQWVTGEYITGLFEAPLPIWSGEPYDVVTALDVFEHFLDPNAALANLVAGLAGDPMPYELTRGPGGAGAGGGAGGGSGGANRPRNANSDFG
ncbi:MAG: methyltransferase domain-containing protein, partial [Alphaproteobacteria bacterium]